MMDSGRTTESQGVAPRGAEPVGVPVNVRETAFPVLFKAESSYVWNALKRLGVPDRDLEDVAHEVFMTVYRRFDDYDAARALRPWLFGIAYRTAARYRDLARNQREVMGDGPEHADETPGPDEQLVALEGRRLLHRALDSIDLDQRAAFLMHDVDGFSMPEIARALAIPLNTAYSRLRLARERVKATLIRLRTQQGER